ncbi:MAG: S8 family serine peptidase [Bacteroidetes bacterium]|nr:S8 family serine peptidase [Bacteroidota bacterium]
MKTKNLHVFRGNVFFTICLFTSISVLFFACKKSEKDILNSVNTSNPLSNGPAGSDDGPVKNNRYIIEASKGKSLSDIVSDAQAEGATVIRVQRQLGFVVVESTASGFLSAMGSKASVGTITPSYDVKWTPSTNPHELDKSRITIPKSHITNTNPFFPLQWSHLAINTHDAWARGQKGNGARVAVVDGGFFPNHPDIINNVNLVLSRNFVVGETLEQAYDDFGHGTHCAGIIAAEDNDIGTVGVAPEAELILVKVLADAGYGSFEDVCAGIVYAADQGVDIISMSLGAEIPRTWKGENVNETRYIRDLINFVKRAVSYATDHGVTVIVAAGNSGINPTASGFLASPVGAPGSLGVSALGPRGWGLNPLTNLDEVASYTNYGTDIVEFSGSGGDFTQYPNELWFLDLVLSTSGAADYYFAAGTSMATPQVAGVAALIVGKYGKMKPAQLKTKLIGCVDDLGAVGRDAYYGHGRINAEKATR